MSRKFIALSILVGFSVAQAAPVPKALDVRPVAMTSPFSTGEAHGGQATAELSLLDIRKEDRGATERLTFAYGTASGEPLRGPAGFYHVTADRDGKRVVVDLAMVSKTAIDPQGLRLALAQSKQVASSNMTMDPQDGSTKIVLNLKSSSRVRVGVDSAEQTKLLLDIEPGGKKL